MKFDSIADTIQSALKSAGLDGKSRLVQRIDATIRHALDAARAAPLSKVHAGLGRSSEPRSIADVVPGTFTRHRFASAAGSRDYKLFVPSVPADRPRPLIVMLHGCKQDPDDFALGTRMNDLAERHGFVVAYPAQSLNANGSNCWNWFTPGDQARDGGEADLIAGIAQQVAESHTIDRHRIFVAGLSAGAAMAVILGAAYPEVFAGVGAHSGLPRGAAHDVASAFAAMRSGGSAPGASDGHPRVGVPTIVFHGDRDRTVASRNGWDIVDQSRAAFAASKSPLATTVDEGRTADGHAHTTTRFTDATGHARIEHWLIHGGAHAWSGGNPKGSYTAADGPDASAEMVRFFLSQ